MKITISYIKNISKLLIEESNISDNWLQEFA